MGAEFNRRQATRVAIVAWFVVLIVLLVVFVISGVSQRSRTDRLKAHGVPVTVTVTSCLAVASGTGETFTGYTCRGTFRLDGRRYDAAIRGISRLQRDGSTVRALSDADHPTTLSTIQSLKNAPPAWEGFIPAGIVMVLLLLSVALGVWRLRRQPSSDPVPASSGQLAHEV